MAVSLRLLYLIFGHPAVIPTAAATAIPTAPAAVPGTRVGRSDRADPRPFMAATQPASRTAPDAERMFAQHMSAETGEVASSYVAMVSHPQVVVGLIDAAAQATAGYRPRRERRPDRRRARSTSGGSV
jgi:hypothetical protein